MTRKKHGALHLLYHNQLTHEKIINILLSEKTVLEPSSFLIFKRVIDELVNNEELYKKELIRNGNIKYI